MLRSNDYSCFPRKCGDLEHGDFCMRYVLLRLRKIRVFKPATVIVRRKTDPEKCQLPARGRKIIVRPSYCVKRVFDFGRKHQMLGSCASQKGSWRGRFICNSIQWSRKWETGCCSVSITSHWELLCSKRKLEGLMGSKTLSFQYFDLLSRNCKETDRLHAKSLVWLKFWNSESWKMQISTYLGLGGSE